MIENKIVGKTLYIGLCGELDECSAVTTKNKLDKLLLLPQIEKVVIELSQLTFMDSTGIGVLLGRYKRAVGRGIPIFVANPPKSVDKILKLSGIYSIMPKIVAEV